MKKALLIISVLVVAVISTACINNFAVRDLNNKAAIYMQKGDYKQAIERLKSSLDLDSSVFETHYNLAIAYTNDEDYINAISEYEKSLTINPEVSDVYYSLATAQNNLIIGIEQGKYRINPSDDSLYIVEEFSSDKDKKRDLTKEEKNKIEELKTLAIENYTKYLELNPDAKDKSEVEQQISKLSGQDKNNTPEVE